MSVTAITVNFRTADQVIPLITSLRQASVVGQVVVVDNSGELEGRLAGLRSPDVSLITNSENRGFGAAVNQAVEKAECQWLLVINPDVRLETDSLIQLLDAGNQYKAPIVGPRFYWDDQMAFRLPPATGGCLWFEIASQCSARFQLDAELFSFFWTIRHQRFWEAAEPFFEPFLSGACLLVEKQWIHSLGESLFDERFFLYFEDSDLCMRALKCGVRPLCVPAANVIHYYDQSPQPEAGKMSHMCEAHAAYFRKYYGEMSLAIPGSPFYGPKLTDLGQFREAPVFEVAHNGFPSEAFFEVSVNPYFVPFAQMTVSVTSFQFPEDVWSRLSPGIYYSRVRDPLKGNLVVWQWKKA
jgi:GT2 family glycosyltransferase